MAQKPGSIVHVEIHSADPTRTKRFFGDVFGWSFEDVPQMNYTMWRAPSAPGGGLQAPMAGQPPQILNYILAKDVSSTASKISSAGGAILIPKTEIPGQGWFAVFREPGGTVLALYENMPRPRARPAKKKAKAKKAAGKKRRK